MESSGARERLLASLEYSRRRLAEAFERAPSFAVIYRGLEHRSEYVNAAYYQLVGHRPVLGRPLDEAIPEARAQGFTALLDQVLATGAPVEFREAPVELARTPGTPPEQRFVDMVFQPLAEADGTVTGVLAHGVDVTDHVRARQTAERLLTEAQAARAAGERERREFEAVLGALPVGVIVVEAPTGRVRWVNAAMAALWGHAPQTARVEDYSVEWTGYHVVAGKPTDRAYASVEWPVARVLATGAPVLDESIVAVHPGGARRMVSVSAAPVHDAEEALVGVVGTVTDMETAYRAQRQIDAAREAAEAASRAKSDFLASMSHELRTPLNAIQGHIQLLAMELHGPITVAQREALERVGRAQTHLLGLINDVLNHARLEAGKVAFDLGPVAVCEVVRDVAPMIEPQLQAKGLELVVDLPAGAGAAGEPPVWVWADRDKLGQVLLNLLANAIKFTPGVQANGSRGRVTIDVAARAGRAGRAFIRVSDTGIGIPREKQAAVFEPFVQVSTGLTRSSEGTGLGLAISRDLARGMDGELRVRSREGLGSTFTISLRRVAPDQIPAPVEPAAATTVEARGRRSGGDRRTGSERRQHVTPRAPTSPAPTSPAPDGRPTTGRSATNLASAGPSSTAPTVPADAAHGGSHGSAEGARDLPATTVSSVAPCPPTERNVRGRRSSRGG